MSTRDVTDATFESEVLQSEKTIMVDFWAEWCGPCRMVAPIVEALADEYSEDGVTVGKVDVDQNPDVTVRFAVRSIPSVLFFKDGEHVDTVVGAVPRPTLEAKIKEHM